MKRLPTPDAVSLGLIGAVGYGSFFVAMLRESKIPRALAAAFLLSSLASGATLSALRQQNVLTVYAAVGIILGCALVASRGKPSLFLSLGDSDEADYVAFKVQRRAILMSIIPIVILLIVFHAYI